ncbi:hypothetical protein QBC38DRAFT_516704 [Podospora fimiseda]|uniref:Heterokaryon incompatibility domain-containing protein n=1 Tax=Podospora fimiseda TaxID=252190 RepID=A0AAN7GP30_9PEZI|nr:hypothetical protein QBC38DRAFT_516704 [Podospora fimiseda]
MPTVQTLAPPPTPPRRGSNLSIQHDQAISDSDAKRPVVAEQLCGNCSGIKFNEEIQNPSRKNHTLKNTAPLKHLFEWTLPHGVNGREAIKWRFKKSAEAKWPFGITYDSIKVAEDEANKTGNGEVDFEEDEDNKTEMAVLNESTRVGLATVQQVDGNAQRGKFYGWTQAVLPDSGFLMLMSKNKVPAALRVVVYGPSHPREGVIEVKLWDTSRAIGRELKLLSRFNLRVASPILAPTLDKQLRYGRLIGGDKIDLGLCRQWLHHCITTHCDACGAPSWLTNLRKTGTMNARFIDVIQMTLVEKDAGCCEYVALSYVWGTPDQDLSSYELLFFAISGMLKILITNQRGRPLLHGLPEEFFDKALHWHHSAATQSNVRLRLRPGGAFPTWSWAAWEAVDLLSSGGRTTTSGCKQINTPATATAPWAPFRQVDQLTNETFSLFFSSCSVSNVIHYSPTSKRHRPWTHPRLRRQPPEWSDSVHSALNYIDRDINLSSIPFKFDQSSVGHHLVFRTYTGQFGLGPTRWRTETLWKRNKESKVLRYKELEIRETAILDHGGEQQEIGRVMLPDPQEIPNTRSLSGLYDFIVISEAQFFGDEKSVEVGEWGLFNVMMVDRSRGSEGMCTRFGMGKITKDAWWAAGPK